MTLPMSGTNTASSNDATNQTMVKMIRRRFSLRCTSNTDNFFASVQTLSRAALEIYHTKQDQLSTTAYPRLLNVIRGKP